MFERALNFLGSHSLEIASWGLLFATVVLAGVTYFQLREAKKMRRQVPDLEKERERDREVDRSQALVVATCADAGAFDWRIILRNKGRGAARGIKISLDGKDLSQHRANSVVPLEALGPGSSFTYTLRRVRTNEPYPREIEITWEDDSGLPGKFETTVNLLVR